MEIVSADTIKEISIYLKFRLVGRQNTTDNFIEDRITKTGKSVGSRREKERVIGAVILKVMEWHRLYIQEGITLEKGATMVGISKKSLDDYFLQLRIAQANGFNFNEHKDDKIGIMRLFNKSRP